MFVKVFIHPKPFRAISDDLQNFDVVVFAVCLGKLGSFRGPGLKEGLSVLAEIKERLGVPVLTDVHLAEQVADVAAVVDVLQTPAFLCRQTDFIQAVCAAGKPVNIKKGQFLAPWDMKHVVEKGRATGNRQIMVCERGASFGYNTLVSDMRGLAQMREFGCPVVFAATHSVQQPGGRGTESGGQSRLVPVVARAAIAAGVSGVFMETHPDPSSAQCQTTSALRPLRSSVSWAPPSRSYLL